MLRLDVGEGAQAASVTAHNMPALEQGLSLIASSMGAGEACCSLMDISISPIADGDMSLRLWRVLLGSLLQT